MFFVKATLAPGVCVRVEVRSDNVFTRCHCCGDEMQVNLTEVFADGKGTLEDTDVLCKDCTDMLMERIDYPRAVQIYNHYRKHLIGAYWQSMGLTVIPSVCWSDHESFDWCFDGEPVGGCVAVSSVGTQKSPSARSLFMDGYNEMLRRLRPERIIFFGDVPSGCTGNIEQHAPYYQAVHARRRC